MNIFDFFDMFSEIMGFFKAAGEDIDTFLLRLKKKIKQSSFANRKADEGWTSDERRQAREPWDFMPPEYWQERMREKLAEKEQLDKQIIEDYEARHASEKTDEQELGQTNDTESSEAEDSISSDEDSEAEAYDSGESQDAFGDSGAFESGFDSDSDGSSPGSDGYID